MKEIRNANKTKVCVGISPLESPTELPKVSQNLARSAYGQGKASAKQQRWTPIDSLQISIIFM